MKRFLLPTTAISLSRLFVCLLALAVWVGVSHSVHAAALNLPSGSQTVSTDTTFEGGIIGTSGAPTFTINSGITATFSAGYTLHYGTGGRWRQNGTGILLNQGTLAYSNALNVGLSWQGNDGTFINEGLFDFVGASTGNNGGLYFYDASGTIINSNGTVQVSSGNQHNWGQNSGTMICYGGTIRVTNGASSIKFDQNNYDIYDATFETDSTSWIRLRRSPGYVSGTSYGNRPLQIAGNSFATDSGGTVVDVDGLGVQFGAGTTSYALYLTGGTVMENRGIWTFVGSGGAQHQPQQGGTFLNSGTVYQLHTGTVGIRPYNGSDFQNSGTWVISNSYWYCSNSGSTIENLPGGSFINHGNSYVYQSQANFRNQGTVESLSGTLYFNNSANAINTNTMSGGVLKEGTWKANGGNINFGFTSTDITQINSGASVILSGTSTMDELDINPGGTLATLSGTLGLHDSKTMSSAALTTAGSTVFEFGLDSGASPKLTIGGSSTLQGTVNVVDLGDVVAGSYTVIDFSSGDLTDGGLVEGSFTTSQNLTMSMTVDTGTDTVVINIAAPPTGAVYLVQ